MKEALMNVAIAQVPNVIALFREAFSKANPDASEPTEEQVIAAFNSAFQSSLAKDDAWLRAHPPGTP